MPASLTPLESSTPDALLTGDPRRAFALAQALMVQPKMSHQARGLWGYTGTVPSGAGLSVQSTGVGGPGATTVLGDLAGFGVRRVVRLGTCVAPGDQFSPGQALLVESAISRDGSSIALSGGAGKQLPDAGLFELLKDIAPAAAVSSHDFVARFDPDGPLPDLDAVARDMQTAATFAMARRIGVEAAALLVVVGPGDSVNLAEAELTDLFVALGQQVVERLPATNT